LWPSIGGISRPLLTKKNADAKAYEIRKIAQAIADSQKLLGPVGYESGNITIDAPGQSDSQELPEATLDKRVISRMAFQEAKKQANIEKITRHAAEELTNEQNINSERPNPDWIIRFFRIAEDITSEQMQILWGKVLAGEVKTPNSYSLRTLELLKNITQQEAEIFVKVGQVSFVCGNKAFIPKPDKGNYLKQHLGLQFIDFLLIREIDLLVATDLEFSIPPAIQNTQIVFECGNTCILINRPKETPKQAIQAIVFTRIGRELLKLVEKRTADPKYIMKFASLFRHEGVSIQSGQIVDRQGDQIHYDNLQDVPDDSIKKKK